MQNEKAIKSNKVNKTQYQRAVGSFNWPNIGLARVSAKGENRKKYIF